MIIFDNFKPDDKGKLLSAFNELLAQQRIWENIFFAI